MNGSGESGIALVVALMTIVLMMALGAALVLITSSETMIAANFQVGHEAFYAADAAFERALADLPALPDWTSVLSGGAQSSFTDGLPAGPRTLTDGSTIDLAELTNIANCQKPTPCSSADIVATTSDRPWGANNPRWTLYAYGKLADSLGTASISSPFYVIVFVGDDPSENDNDPLTDGASVGGLPNPGLGLLSLRAEAFGPRNAHRIIEATVVRRVAVPAGPGGGGTDLRVLSWREVR